MSGGRDEWRDIHRAEIGDDEHDLKAGEVHSRLDGGLLEQLNIHATGRDHLTNDQVRGKPAPQSRGQDKIAGLDIHILRDHVQGNIARHRAGQDRLSIRILQADIDAGSWISNQLDARRVRDGGRALSVFGCAGPRDALPTGS